MWSGKAAKTQVSDCVLAGLNAGAAEKSLCASKPNVTQHDAMHMTRCT
jgi:hypothetical protein